MSEKWLDFSWVSDESFHHYLNRTREMADRFSPDDLESNPILGALLVLDLDAAPDARKWFARLGGGLVHAIREDLSSAATFRLRWEGRESGGLAGMALAVDDSGSMVCAAAPGLAAVPCYALPDELWGTRDDGS